MKANTSDNARNIIDMYKPRRRLDCSWGVMGIGMGYAIGASVTSGSPVVAIEGDSAFGFSGMEIETICRYNLPVTIVILIMAASTEETVLIQWRWCTITNGSVAPCKV